MRSRFNAYIGVLALYLLLVAMATPSAPAQAQEEQGEYEPNELVLKLFSASDLAAVAAQYQLTPTPKDQFGTRPIFLLGIADGSDPLDKAAQLSGDARVQFAEPNYLAETPEGRRKRPPWQIGEGDAKETEEQYLAQWATTKLRLGEAHTASSGAGVTVAVLDTGVDRNHPALAGRLLPGFDFVNFDDDPSEVGTYGIDYGYGHGTHVAGLVALVAPDARILPVRVLDEDGVGNIWVLSEGISYALDPDGNPDTLDGATVINMSLGTLRRTELLDELVAEATCAVIDDDDDGDSANKYDDDDDDDDDRGRKIDDDDDDEGEDADRCSATGGTVVISAAGNGGDSVPQYPAAEQVRGAMAIAASTASDTLASFSTRGPWVQVSAPGEEIVSTVPEGRYGTWSGTSMAAPNAAGAVALLRSADPGLDAGAVVDRMMSSAQALCGDGPGRIDAAAALGLSAPEPRSCAQSYLPLIVAGP